MKKYVLIIALIVGGLTACSDWLDVQPKTSIKGKDLFSSESGFKDVLTGFYLSMGSTEIYAKEMTYGYLDLLAGNYDNYPGEVNATDRYDYESTYAGTKDAIYSKMYNIIANINNFLRYLDENRSVITTENYYEVMKGEALGLRAFLHFDLLRLFGPIYKDNPQGAAVPYRTKFDNVATPILPASEVLDLVIADLLEAEELLDGHDSEIFNYDDSADPFTEMRQMWMNVWAVRAMLARAYCYKGDEASKAEALKYAKSVIECEHFALAPNGRRDASQPPFWGEEVIFGLYIYDYYQIVDELFKNASYSYLLSAYSSNVSTWFPQNDDRYWFFSEYRESGNSPISVSVKYDQDRYSSARDSYSPMNTQPLIRLPEMYYIAAECEPDPATAVSYLDEVIFSRTGQSSSTVTAGFDQTDSRQIYGVYTGQTVRVNELYREYFKEFYGEGQLFFFYKRFGFTAFPNPIDDTMDPAAYQMPLPDDEYTYGNNN